MQLIQKAEAGYSSKSQAPVVDSYKKVVGKSFKLISV